MRNFGRILFAITVLAFAVRVLFSVTVAEDRPFGGVDADRYHDLAGSIAGGEGYSWHPGRSAWVRGDPTLVEPDAQHPPLHPTLLAATDLFGRRSWTDHRVLLSLIAAAGVAVTGLLGRRLFSAQVGLLAAGIGAVHPLWFQYPGYLVSEATYLLVVPAALLAAVHALRSGRYTAFALLGLSIGLCALTRAEGLLLLPILGLPVAWLSHGRRLAAAALIGAGAACLVGPWMLRNHETFGSASISLNGGVTISGSNCDDSYHGSHLGTFGGCALANGAAIRMGHPGEQLGQGAMDREQRKVGIQYAKNHASRLPVVALARLGRTAGIYRLHDSLDFDVDIGGDRPWQRIGYGVHFVLLVLAGLGSMVHLKRFRQQRSRERWGKMWVLLAGPLLSALTGVAIYGATRMRVAAEPAIVILAASAVIELAKRARRGRGVALDG